MNQNSLCDQEEQQKAENRVESAVGNSCSGCVWMNRWDAQDSSSIQSVGERAKWLRTSV